VFNRGFWDGYYQGAKLGEWSDVYGNKATRKKRYVGKVTNYFSNLSVAEVLIETGELRTGEQILITGPSTGVIECEAQEIRVDLKVTEKAVKGEYCSIPVPAGVKLRRSDKIYIWEEAHVS
ncbi:MAG: U32 family peptidase, partial [Bacteroidales bacterium]|nr:U32 family peptidase [Bacteroidales bacterium]